MPPHSTVNFTAVDEVLTAYNQISSNVEAVVVGKALYEGKFTVEEALVALRAGK